MPSPSLALDTPDLARHYERASHDRQFKWGQALIQGLGITSGERVLDVGAGTGLLASHVAEIVGASGLVVGVDPLPLRIDIAQAKARPNLRFLVGNAYDLGGFPEEHFDVVYLNAVFHWLAEKVEPLRQFHRVLRRGGRLGIATGSKDHVNELQAIKDRVLSRAPYSRYPDAQGNAAHRVSLNELGGLLETTGFRTTRLELQPSVTVHASPADAIEFSQASSFGNFLGHLPEELRRPARKEIETQLETLRTPQGIRQENARILAFAEKI